jgi:hypothetical protein
MSGHLLFPARLPLPARTPRSFHRRKATPVAIDIARFEGRIYRMVGTDASGGVSKLQHISGGPPVNLLVEDGAIGGGNAHKSLFGGL